MATSVKSVRGDLYEADFVVWAEAQAEALRASSSQFGRRRVAKAREI